MASYNIVNADTLVAGAAEDISQVMANFQAIASIINGQLDNANLAANAAIAISKLALFPNDSTKFLRGDGVWSVVTGGSGIIAPTGTMFPYVDSTPPPGFLLCDGTAVSRTTYSTLFGLISTKFGAGDGSTTFNVPDVRGRVLVGLGTHVDVGAIGANEGMSSVAARRPKHKHTGSWNFTGSFVSTNNENQSHVHLFGREVVSLTPGPTDYSILGNQSIYDAQTSVEQTPHTHNFTAYGTVTGSVGPQTGNEPTDTVAYLTLPFVIKT